MLGGKAADGLLPALTAALLFAVDAGPAFPLATFVFGFVSVNELQLGILPATTKAMASEPSTERKVSVIESLRFCERNFFAEDMGLNLPLI